MSHTMERRASRPSSRAGTPGSPPATLVDSGARYCKLSTSISLQHHHSRSHARLAVSQPPLRMRILTRYILGEVVSHALIGAAVFTFVLFTRDLGRILELVVRNSAPLPSVAEIFFFTVPVALTYTIPMGVLVGILIGLSRLAADSEITAMRASGLGVWTFLRVISIFVVVGWLLALGNSMYLAPRSSPPWNSSRTSSSLLRLLSKFSPACSTRDSRR